MEVDLRATLGVWPLSRFGQGFGQRAVVRLKKNLKKGEKGEMTCCQAISQFGMSAAPSAGRSREHGRHGRQRRRATPLAQG